MIKKLFSTTIIIMVLATAFAQDSSGASTNALSKLVERKSNNSHLIAFPAAVANYTAFNQYSSSAGFASYSAKGFANSFSYNSVERFNGTQNYSALFNSTFSELMFNTLDLETMEIAVSGQPVIGNTIGGVVDLNTQNPFTSQQLAISQHSGFNKQFGLYNKTRLRYAQAFGRKQNVALELSGEYTQKAEWQFDNDNQNLYAAGNAQADLSEQLRARQFQPVGPQFTQQQKDFAIAMNSWLDFNPIASPGRIQVDLPGYAEKDLTENKFTNIKARGGLHFNLGKQVKLAATYRFAQFNTIVQPYFRYQLKNYTVHQPQLELKGKDFFVRAYGSIENPGQSYNISRTGYQLNNRLNTEYISRYSENYLSAYFNLLDTLTNGFCEDCVNQSDVDSARKAANYFAPRTFYQQKGFAGFDTAFNSVKTDTSLNNGGAWLARAKTFYADAEYRFGFLKWMSIGLGANYQLLMPANNEWNTGGKKFHQAAAYLNASKTLWKERFKIFATGRFGYNTDFGPRGDYRAGISFTMNNQSVTISSGSGYTLPTMAQRYMQLSNYYQWYRKNESVQADWFSGAAVQDFEDYRAVAPSYEALYHKLNTLEIFRVTPLKPQEIKTIELTVSNKFAQRFTLLTQGYFNWIENTTALANLVVPASGTVGHNNTPNDQQGLDNIAIGPPYYAHFITWTNLPVKTNSWGAFINLQYAGWHGINPYINYHYFGHKNIEAGTKAIVAFNDFNTPAHKINIGVTAADVWHGLGFNINFRWVSAFDWQTDFAKGQVPFYHTLDLSLQYHLPSLYSTISLGASNIYGNRHTEIPGSPRVGAWYYAGFMFDLDLKKKN